MRFFRLTFNRPSILLLLISLDSFEFIIFFHHFTAVFFFVSAVFGIIYKYYIFFFPLNIILCLHFRTRKLCNYALAELKTRLIKKKKKNERKPVDNRTATTCTHNINYIFEYSPICMNILYIGRCITSYCNIASSFFDYNHVAS